jgi:hypothetical protein
VVYEMRPDIEQVIGDEVLREALGDALEKAWQRILHDLIDSCLKSMQ